MPRLLARLLAAVWQLRRVKIYVEPSLKAVLRCVLNVKEQSKRCRRRNPRAQEARGSIASDLALALS